MPTKVCLVKAMAFPVVLYGCENWTIKLTLLNCGVGEDSWESLGLQGDPTSQSQRKLVLNIHWKDWCWSWSSNTLATWCEELTHWKRLWCWERLKAGERDDRGWDGYQLNGHEFQQAPGVGDGQGSLACCSLCGPKELDTTEQLIWTECMYVNATLSVGPTISFPCSVHSLFSTSASLFLPWDRFISTTFLDSIYMR